MRNKGKIIAAIIAIAVIVAGVMIYLNIQPKLKLKAALEEIVNEDFKYSLDYTIEGLDSSLFEGNPEGNISGTKDSDLLYGIVSFHDFEAVELYMDTDYNMIFNVEPLFNSAVESLQDKIGISLPLMQNLVNDFYVSLDQIEEITGKDIITISDTGISSDVFESISGEDVSKVAYVLKQVKNTDEIDTLLGEDALYFSITFDDNDSYMIVGIPKNQEKKQLSVEIYSNEATWKLKMDYELGTVEPKQMPEVTLSDSTIEVLKKIYSYWEEYNET
jgi:hypothetical protein